MLNKGKIIQAERVDVRGQVISNVGLTVTAEMMPSFRFVAFYRIPWQRREEVVSDSIWVDVADICPGAVSDMADSSRGFKKGNNETSTGLDAELQYICSIII